jgi:oligopeptide/dipeptide ABC transporter ATP-binding protein
MRAGQLIEVASVEEIFARPQHPYTRLLMESLPSFERAGTLLSRVVAQHAAAGLATEAVR